MSEQIISPSTTVTFGPGGGGDPLADGSGIGGLVTVSHGVFGEPLPVGGMTVGEVRRRLADRLGIDPRSRAEINGRTVGDDIVVRPGEQLHFVRSAGEKGALAA